MAARLDLTNPDVLAKVAELDATDELHVLLVAFVRDDLGTRWTNDHGEELLTLRAKAFFALELASVGA